MAMSLPLPMAQPSHADDAAAEVDESFRSLESCLVISGPDFLSDENGGRIGKAAEEGNDQTLHGTEDRHGGDGLLGLASQHDVDQHVSHTDEHLIADDGEAFFKILGNSGAGPAEMLGKFQYIGNLFIKNKADQNQKVTMPARTVPTAAPEAPIFGSPHFPKMKR